MADQKVLKFSDEEKEVWKDIEGFEGLYKISNKGRVSSYYNSSIWGLRDEPKVMKLGESHNGYSQLNLVKDGNRYHKRVNRLVANAFIPNPDDKPQVNHIDGDKSNNCAENLEWVTAQENTDHAIENGLSNLSGEDNGYSKLTKNDVIQIRNTYRLGVFYQREIAEAWGISQLHVSRIVRRKVWKHI